MAVCAALVVHGTVLGTVHAVGLAIGEGYAKAKPKVAETEQELKPTCVGDAGLVASARMTMCLAPWRGDTDACLDEAQLGLWIDLSSCQLRNDPNIASVSMLEPPATSKMKSIDPEPLLEQLAQQQPKPPPTPVVPPLQVQQPPPPAPPPPPRPMQVVETAKPTQEQAPDNARFLAEYDTRVEKEKVARGAVKEPMVAKSKPAELTAKQDPKEASIKEHEPDRERGTDQRAPDVPGLLSMRTPGAMSPAEAQQDAKTRGSTSGASGPLAFDGFVPRKGDGALEQQQHERSEIPRGQNGAGGGAPEVPNLKPTQEVLERALGGGSVDHLEQVESSDETALSAKRWVYASFFNRLKRQVAQNWDPGSVWRRSDPTGQVYGYKTRITEVRVSLSPKGELAKIVVIAPSGVSDLDDEAVRAFHLAAPFPNPPKELVSSNDHLIVFAFSFYFEIGGARTSWRVIRSM